MSQLGLEREEKPRDQIANILWIIEKAMEFQKNIYLCFIDYAKAFVDHDKLLKALKEMAMPDDLICLLRNLYSGEEATVYLFIYLFYYIAPFVWYKVMW